jgi:hypothetical protein
MSDVNVSQHVREQLGTSARRRGDDRTAAVLLRATAGVGVECYGVPVNNGFFTA